MQNKLLIITRSLTRFNIDLFYKFIYYRLLCSKYFYYTKLLHILKGKPLMQYGSGSYFIKRRVYTVLRSPFIHKKSREQFEYRSTKSNFFIYSPFNLRYRGNPFVTYWISLGNCPFRNNHIQVKSFNRYLMLK